MVFDDLEALDNS